MKVLGLVFWFLAAAMKHARRATGPVAGVLYALLPVLAIPLTGVLFYVVARVIELPFAPWAWGVFGVVIAILASADHGAGFSFDALSDDLGRRRLETSHRLVANRIRRQWPQTCTALGWDTSAAAHEHKRDRGPVGQLRMPQLRFVQSLPGMLRIVWRPRGDQDQKQWPALVDALRRQLGMHSADFREHPIEPGTIVAAFGASPLPAMLRHQDHAPRPAESLPEGFALGAKAGGGDALWIPSQAPHMLVTGTTGGGKSALIRLLVMQARGQLYAIRIIDPKGAGDFRWASDLGVAVAHDLEDELETLREVRAEVERRSRLLWSAGVEKLSELPDDERPAPMLVIVDEAADLFLLRRVKAEKDNDELRGEAGSLASIIASQGRAASVHLLVCLQRPDATLLGPAGGFMRNNLPAKMAFGRMDADGLQMLFGAGAGEHAMKLTGTPGRAVALGLRTGEVEPYAVQVAYVTAAELRPVPDPESAPQEAPDPEPVAA